MGNEKYVHSRQEDTSAPREETSRTSPHLILHQPPQRESLHNHCTITAPAAHGLSQFCRSKSTPPLNNSLHQEHMLLANLRKESGAPPSKFSWCKESGGGLPLFAEKYPCTNLLAQLLGRLLAGWQKVAEILHAHVK